MFIWLILVSLRWCSVRHQMCGGTGNMELISLSVLLIRPQIFWWCIMSELLSGFSVLFTIKNLRFLMLGAFSFLWILWVLHLKMKWWLMFSCHYFHTLWYIFYSCFLESYVQWPFALFHFLVALGDSELYFGLFPFLVALCLILVWVRILLNFHTLCYNFHLFADHFLLRILAWILLNLTSRRSCLDCLMCSIHWLLLIINNNIFIFSNKSYQIQSKSISI